MAFFPEVLLLKPGSHHESSWLRARLGRIVSGIVDSYDQYLRYQKSSCVYFEQHKIWKRGFAAGPIRNRQNLESERTGKMHGQILRHFQLLQLGQHPNPPKIVIRSMLHRQLDLPGLDKQTDSLNHVSCCQSDKLN